LAKQYGAIAAVKNGNLLFIKQDQMKTARDKPIPVMTIIRSLGGSHQFSIADRGAYTGLWRTGLVPTPPKDQRSGGQVVMF
jgi:phage protein D